MFLLPGRMTIVIDAPSESAFDRPHLKPSRPVARPLLLLMLSLGLWLGGCASPSAPESLDPIELMLSGGAPDAQVIDQGLASWYGERFHGRRTASGEPFDMRDLTAAHKTLPFGTRVRVRNVNNGREVVVRINDRGPFSPKRVIDLSHAAASALGMLRSGVVSVQLLRE